MLIQRALTFRWQSISSCILPRYQNKRCSLLASGDTVDMLFSPERYILLPNKHSLSYTKDITLGLGFLWKRKDQQFFCVRQ